MPGPSRDRHGFIVRPLDEDADNAGASAAAAAGPAGAPSSAGASTASASDAAVPPNMMAALMQELATLRAAVAARAPSSSAGPTVEPVSASTMLALRKAVPRFGGHVSYDVFRASFDDLLGSYPGLTDRQRFQLLVSALDKEPLSMLEDLGTERNFDTLDDALRMAYSKPVHAPTEMRKFFALHQGADESLEDWSTRVSRSARRAYPDTATVRVEEYAVQQFISGLKDTDVRGGVAGSSFSSMRQALNACRLARSRCPSPPPKKVRVATLDESVVEAAPTPDPIAAKLDELSKRVELIVQTAQVQPAAAAAPNNGAHSTF